MNSLTIKINTHVIVTFKNSKYFVTQKQYDVIKNMGGNEKITLDTGILNTNSISEIQTIKDYYNNHPNERPQFENLSHKEAPQMKYSEKRSLRNLNTMRDSFVKYFNGRVLNPSQQKILDIMNHKIMNFKIGDKVEPAKILFGIK